MSDDPCGHDGLGVAVCPMCDPEHAEHYDMVAALIAAKDRIATLTRDLADAKTVLADNAKQLQAAVDRELKMHAELAEARADLACATEFVVDSTDPDAVYVVEKVTARSTWRVMVSGPCFGGPVGDGFATLAEALAHARTLAGAAKEEG